MQQANQLASQLTTPSMYVQSENGHNAGNVVARAHVERLVRELAGRLGRAALSTQLRADNVDGILGRQHVPHAVASCREAPSAQESSAGAGGREQRTEDEELVLFRTENVLPAHGRARQQPASQPAQKERRTSWISGLAMTSSAFFMLRSPRVRDTASPPGYTRYGPAGSAASGEAPTTAAGADAPV
jgi:hypothetical protein